MFVQQPGMEIFHFLLPVLGLNCLLTDSGLSRKRRKPGVFPFFGVIYMVCFTERSIFNRSSGAQPNVNSKILYGV